ncbi:dihydroorotase [Methanonatronarchaeum sp. AMET-Sl]|uniref:dihydroorotase n=1 Tax=Methanonatronarchaeum sp. AMET-Sl TaxID=3037654 RepID=UPI00244DA682|nr:dihydroorotase [Methanonatronarchaeum sp. AMET-Sl]WGI17254.1 dihydroorotase [Methanonatronarchaeum sp. AMET-Sl]
MKVVKGGKIYYKGRLVEAEIGIQQGKITKIKKTGLKGDFIDASGMIVLPGAIDIHVHFRDMELSDKETWETGSKAAAAGGVTTVIEQPNTSPPTDSKKTYIKKKKKAKSSSFVDYGINGAVAIHSDISGLSDLVSGFGETFLAGGNDLHVRYEDLDGLLKAVETTDKVLTIHAEDEELVKKGLKRYKKTRKSNYPDSRPPKAEEKAVKITLEKYRENENKPPLHFCHISSARTLKHIPEKPTVEVTPHHLLLTKTEINSKGSYVKTNPPIRGRKNRAQLWQALNSGKIDVIVSDHAPHTYNEKEQDFWKAPSGVPGVQTMVPQLAYHVKKRNLSLKRFVTTLCEKPSDIFGLDKGYIQKGMDADLIFMDFNDITRIKKNMLYSKCGWTPYNGRRAIFPQKTMLRGKVIYKKSGFREKIGEEIEQGNRKSRKNTKTN